MDALKEAVQIEIAKFNDQGKLGKNDYNIFSALLGIHDEVRLHSRFIFSLLNPMGKHYQKSEFLKLFFNNCLDETFLKDFNFDKATAIKEYKNIDIYITDGKNSIIIENKIYANDQNNQLSNYIKTIAKEENPDKIYVLYLTLRDKYPTEYTIGEFKDKIKVNDSIDLFVTNITYEKHIQNWINECIDYFQEYKKFEILLSQYRDILDQIFGNYNFKKPNLLGIIKKYFLDCKKIYQNKGELEEYQILLKDSFREGKAFIVSNFMEKVKEELETNLNKLLGDWIVKIHKADEWSGDYRYYKPISIYKKDWDSNSLQFAVEFQYTDYTYPWLGLYCPIDKDKLGTLKNKIQNKVGNEQWYTNEWWVYGEYLNTEPNGSLNKRFKGSLLDYIYENYKSSDDFAEIFADQLFNIIKKLHENKTCDIVKELIDDKK